MACLQASCDDARTRAAAASASANRPTDRASQTAAPAEPTVDPRALEEIVGSTPPPLPPTSASATLVGTDTGLAGNEKPEPEPESDSMFSMLPPWAASNASSERDLRGTLYFELVNRCRDESGATLPPEAVVLELRIDPKGHIDRSSVRAKPRDPRYQAAAACMVRVARTSEALLTPPRLEKPVIITAVVPSVD